MHKLEDFLNISNFKNKKEQLFLQKNELKISYSHFYSLVKKRSFDLSSIINENDKVIALLIEDPLSFLVNLFSLWENNKTAFLLPAFLSSKDLQKKIKQFEIKKVLEDSTNYWKLPLDIKENSYSADPQTIKSMEEIALIILTSGSSQNEKAVMLSFNNLIKSALGTNEFYQVNQSDQWLLTLPLHHVGGLMIPIRMIVTNGSIFIPDQKDLNTCIEKYSPTFISLVPTQLQRLISSPFLNKFKAIILGGARTSSHLLSQACKRKLNLANSYGLSEMCAQVTSTPICHDLNLLKTGGKVLPYRNLNINSSNEIILSGETLYKGYYQNEASLLNIALKSKPKNLKTNDLGAFDCNSNLLYLGRKDNIFISGGENINPVILENKILSFYPLIESIYIASVNHHHFGKVPFYFIKSKNNYERNDFKTHLLKYELPYQVFDLNSLPDPETIGKIKYSRQKLQDIAEKLFIDESSPFSIKKEGNPTKDPIIFFHGFMGKKEDWDENILKLKKDFFCISIDLPGHGKTKIEGFTSLEDILLKLEELLSSYEGNLRAIGYSLGGRIAAQLLKRNPNIFKQTLLESTNFGLLDNQEKIKRSKSDQLMFKHIKNKNDYEKFLINWYQLDIFRGMKENPIFFKLLNSRLDNNLLSLTKSIQLLGLGNMPYLLDSLLKLASKNSLLVITGEDDLKYKNITKKSKLPYILLENCSHNTHFLRPDSFNQVVLDFFKAR